MKESMMRHQINDFARAVRIDALKQENIGQKLRIVGKLRLYDAENSLICIADDEDTLMVDISLCLSGYRSLPWLREENAIIMAIGYLENFEELSTEDAPVMILRAVFIKEPRGLELDVWNKGIEASSRTY